MAQPLYTSIDPVSAERSIRWWYVATSLCYVRPLLAVLWPFMLDRGVGLAEKGWIFTISTVVALFASSVMAGLADKFSYRRSVLLSTVLAMAAWWVFLVAPSWELIAVAYTLLVVSDVLCYAQLQGLMRLLLERAVGDKSSREIRFRQIQTRRQVIANGVGLVLSGYVAGVLLLIDEEGGFYAILVLSIVATAGGFFTTRKIYEPPRAPTTPQFSSASNGRFTSVFWLLFVLVSCGVFGAASATLWRQPYMLAVGFSAGGASVAQASYQIIWVIALLVQSRYMRFFNKGQWPLLVLGIGLPLSLIAMSYANSPVSAFCCLLFFSGSLMSTMMLVTAKLLELDESQGYIAQITLANTAVGQLSYALYSPFAGQVMQVGADHQDTLGAIHRVQLGTGLVLLGIGAIAVLGILRQPNGSR